ncbi:predicted protein [Naegleria gruberi]|uniref:Predicted protein n=1 Tax=Naegleria gruberi TaxID=5762 RepID=D2W0M9_NAEGR|nr:uncharacterized protein NAEGRDRAFT_74916 [Naegleria gruberi]EFC37364.1 predicted protein [Naegleria gruberi]|eukprot:XP_002670108.1 predicted protein [Naegleria gruberi strain NEG-M]
MQHTAGESNNSKPTSPQGFGTTVSLSNDESEEHMEESVNSEESSEYQPGLQRTFVNNAMMRDNDDHLVEEDDNMYGVNNMDHHQSFNMGSGNQGSFNLHKSSSGNGAPGSSTGSSSTSNPAAAHLSTAAAAAKKRRRFTPEEDKKIKEGIAKHKKDNNIDWDGVAKYACIERTKEQIKSRYMRMRKDDGEPVSTAQQASSSGVSSSTNNAGSSNNNASNIISGQNSGDKYSNNTINTSTNNNNNNNQITIPSSVSSSITENSTTYQSNQPQSLPQTSPVIYLAPPNSNNTTLNCNKQENSLSIEGEELVEPSNKKQKTLPQMFQSLQASTSKKSQSNMASSSSNQNSNSLYVDASNNSNSFMMSYNSNSSMGSSAINNTGVQSNIEAYQQQIAKLQLELEHVKEQLKQKDKSLENSESKTKGYESEINQMKNAIHDYDIKNNERNKRFREIAVQFLRERAERERIEDKKKVNEKSITIGTITYQKGLDVYEVWQDGTLFQQLKENENRITTEKDKLEKQKKNIQKQRQQLKKEQITTNDAEFIRKLEEQLHDLNEQEETVKLKLIHLKKEETQNIAEQENLLIEKSIQIREIKRIRDQEKSMFKNYPIIGHQKYIPTTPDGPGTPQINGQQPQPSNHHEYFLMKMLGKGGFSEVYKAYDLTDFKVVACKIHQLNPNWKEHRKENYIKHVLRECQINQSINHEKLIKMYDTFVFDNNTFVTVLEYCEGADLDLYIKKHQRVPEREAKNIISQIFSGLNYLCQQKQRVIHYDLKPANILFDKDGNIKITDFGLSKIMDEEESIELTSQGAGTYWYLPPECFYNPSGEGPPPKISNKVDVWSAGVIFFQMLYGTKPFGNNLSQQKILSEGTIVNATQVGFPDKPAVSEEAKEFIRRCLTHEMSKRPDVKTLYNDAYLRGTSTPSSSGTTSKSKKREKEAPQPSSTPTSTTNFLSFQQ